MIPSDIMRVLRLVRWADVGIVFDTGWVKTENTQTESRAAYWRLPHTEQGVLGRAMRNECRTPLDRLVREYMLWKAYSVEAQP